MIHIGIDFGTTNSLMVAYNKSTNKFFYFNFVGDVPTPVSSTVWYNDSTIRVGSVARSNINKLSGIPGNHIEKSIKLKIGKKDSVNVFGDEIKPYKIAAEILRHLKNEAIEKWGANDIKADLSKAVMTVPIKFTGEQRKELRKAANEVGIEVMTFIHEPFAAVIGYFFSQSQANMCDEIIDEIRSLDGKYLLTFDWGGGTLDITVVKVENGKMIELGTSEMTGLAGDKFDEDIAWWAWNKFTSRVRLKYSSAILERFRKEQWDRLLDTAERCKITLSTQESAPFVVESLVHGSHNEGVNEVFTRGDFEILLKDTLVKASNRIDDAIREASISDVNVSSVILTGGSCYIPAIQNMLRKKFGHRVEIVKNADFLIAQGAAVIAEMGWDPFLSKDIGVELSDNSIWPIFDKGTPIKRLQSMKTDEVFTCVDQRNKYAKVIICEANGQTKYKNLDILKVPTLGDKRFGDDIVIEAILDKDVILTVKGHSVYIKGYNQKDRTGIDEEYSERKTTSIYQLCFGLEIGDTSYE